MSHPEATAPIPSARKRAGRRVARPLTPSTYLLRNLPKTLPLVGVIVLAVMLITGIVALLNSIPLSIRTIYAYSKEFTGVTPRGDTTQTPILVDRILQLAPVPIERVIICRASGAMVRSIVGKWPFGVVGMAQQDMRFYLDRQHVSSIEGRLPAAGAPEALISEPVARNLNLKIGGTLSGPRVTDSYSQREVKVVGIAQTDRWIILDSIEYQKKYHFPPVDLAMVFAHNAEDQEKLDAWTLAEFKGKRAQIFAYKQLDKDTNDQFKTLYKILNVVIASLVLVITLMMGLLINIYQSQRLVEFGLLQAIGYTKRALVRRVVLESVLVVFVGWLIGLAIAFGLLNIVNMLLMEPNAWAMKTADWLAFAYTAPAPLAILTVAILTVLWRFRSFDPVGVVERRLV